jgi:hypothetical protein
MRFILCGENSDQDRERLAKELLENSDQGGSLEGLDGDGGEIEGMDSYMCIDVFMSVCIHNYASMYIYLYIYIYIYIYIYVYIECKQ